MCGHTHEHEVYDKILDLMGGDGCKSAGSKVKEILVKRELFESLIYDSGKQKIGCVQA